MQQQSNEKDSRTVNAQQLIERFGRDDEAITNLVGYFDVLIQMDLEQKRKERDKSDPNNISATATTVPETTPQRMSIKSNKTRNKDKQRKKTP